MFEKSNRENTDSPTIVQISPRFANSPLSQGNTTLSPRNGFSSPLQSPRDIFGSRFYTSSNLVTADKSKAMVEGKLKQLKEAPKVIKHSTPFSVSKKQVTHYRTKHEEIVAQVVQENVQKIRGRQDSDDKLVRTIEALRVSLNGDSEQRKVAIERMKLLDEMDYSKKLKNISAPRSYSPPERNLYSSVEPRYLQKKKDQKKKESVKASPTFYTKNRNVPSRLYNHEEKQKAKGKATRQEIEERKKAEKEKLLGNPHMTSRPNNRIGNLSDPVPELKHLKLPRRNLQIKQSKIAENRDTAKRAEEGVQSPIRNLINDFNSEMNQSKENEQVKKE